LAIDQALANVRETGNLSVPLDLRNAPTKLMKDIGYGKSYQYAHAYEGNFVAQEYLPIELASHVFYQPGNNPKENEIRKNLAQLWKAKYGY
jgi:putative ATPase